MLPLDRALASTFTLYFKAHSYHWNVQGSDFAQLHSFFGELYEDIHTSIDAMAEQVRALGRHAPFNLKMILSDSGLAEDQHVLSAHDMLINLHESNAIVIHELNDAIKDAKDNQGLINFLADRVDKHSKHAWQLKSFLSEDVNESSWSDTKRRVAGLAAAGVLATGINTVLNASGHWAKTPKARVTHPTTGQVATIERGELPSHMKPESTFTADGVQYVHTKQGYTYVAPKDFKMPGDTKLADKKQRIKSKQ